MIRNQQQLEIVRGQLALVEDGLAELRAELLPGQSAKFEVFSQAHREQIKSLRQEIEQYQGLSMPVIPAKSAHASEQASLP